MSGERNLKKQPLLPKEFDEHCEAGSFEMYILQAARELGFYATDVFHSTVVNLAQMMKCFRSVSIGQLYLYFSKCPTDFIDM
jgi:hypothetical protein